MDIRKSFLDYFSKNNHTIFESMPLVPDDPTLLFTNAGMVQFKDIFTGKTPIPQNPKATSCQLCIRAGGKHNDLENVGYTARHHTLFEMLGNFSFGNYFKKDAIKYAWEFVTEVVGFDEDKLYVSVHEKDDEAFELWTSHIDTSRIKRLGDKDNFWQMGETGACGPCSEIYVDQGAEHFNGSEDYFGGDGDRFLEVWNLVFMQYERSSNGALTPLPKPSIDTGMGLERVAALKEGKRSNYESSIFMPLIHKLEEIVKKKYEYDSGASYRVIADHVRSVSFLLAQGVNFDKEGRGYVLRRILRRAVRHGYLLGLKKPFLYEIVDTLCTGMGGHYGYLWEKKDVIKNQIAMEEERFFATIDGGMELFKIELDKTKDIFSGEVAFKLYDTHGFPLDLTQDMLRDKNIGVDLVIFEECMERQKKQSRASWKGSGDEVKEGEFKKLLERFGKNEFVGYVHFEYKTKILALLNEQMEMTNSLKAGESGYVMLDGTPFYAESGGQCGDSGELHIAVDVVAIVHDTKKYFDLNISKIEAKMAIEAGWDVVAKVDRSRFEIQKHHSATHLLHKALREVLGTHVGQAGSLVESDRLRFDFSHGKAMSVQEIEAVEARVNELIALELDANIAEMGIDEAKASGAMALFGEKYGSSVRVVDFGGESIELCGGTHVPNTAHIGSFFITKESGVSAGVRRIEAVCAQAAIKYAKNALRLLDDARESLKNSDPLLGINKLKEQIKSLKDELQRASSAGKKELSSETLGDVKLVVDSIDVGDIKQIIDDLKNQNEKVAVMLLQVKDEKVTIAAGVKGVSLKAGEWVRNIAPILGGGGGGRDDFAQAGGKDPSKLDEALIKAKEFGKERL